ncbi:MAG: hypothetical protein EXQ87_04835 [Alphaproteobacteria bacterium]|nr:hypothetical protein [Alphaproteobacteria bacterium]
MLGFLKSFVTVKGKQAGQELVRAIVELDPEGATQAELDAMERDLDRTGQMLQKLRADYDREVKEAEAIDKTYREMMAAAEHLEGKLANAATPELDKAGIGQSLAKLVHRLEEMAPRLDEEKQDVEDVKAMLGEAEQAFRAKAQALTQARQTLDRAKRDMQRAGMQQARAEEKARQSAELAGIRQTGGNKLNTALDAMRNRADEARAKAETAKMKGELLRPEVPADDKHLSDAMAAVRGTAPQGNVADRLAALKTRK